MISVVTICPESYAQWVTQALLSVAQQSMKAEAVLVVAGQITPQQITSVRTDVEVCVSPDPGIATCRNIGVAASKGDYIMMLDADDWLAPDFIEKVTPHLAPGRIVCGSLQRFGDQDGFDRAPGKVALIDMLYSNYLFYNCAFHRDDFVGYDTEEAYEDWACWTAMMQRGCTVVVVPEAVLHYRVHASSHTNRTWGLHEKRMQRMRERWGVK